jgi:hypothetical protein
MARRSRHRPPRGRRKDTRTTREVEATRSRINRKPYRTPALKALARDRAVKGKDGAWHSDAPVLHNPTR